MACIIWTGTSEPADLISKLFANENIEAKGTDSEADSIGDSDASAASSGCQLELMHYVQ